MIVVDSSVWIAHLRNTDSVPVGKLRHLDDTQEILVGDLILLEVLQGARNEPHARLIERNLRQFAIVPMLNPATAVEAARNYRMLRQRGITIRKTIDMIIGTFCIQGGHALLHDDRDFDPMVHHLGLQLA
ncbi:VapC toxin family PIN domain ribonuclease [Mesorhizobium sanjuanii]|uniref:VapC toxin family PIN domain ribonuclease n=1 Tax=Mesorhizobium sanjuanii TaxID=2037900 RepID=A0A2A6F961_9HYPH|nr:PIN domain nuclease [Mesorhizobium sanjuanii]PDQ17978.1 VapC toxin family PIN domain ribonuclease [Mesorhizobium sanjuanii]